MTPQCHGLFEHITKRVMARFVRWRDVNGASVRHPNDLPYEFQQLGCIGLARKLRDDAALPIDDGCELRLCTDIERRRLGHPASCRRIDRHIRAQLFLGAHAGEALRGARAEIRGDQIRIGEVAEDPVAGPAEMLKDEAVIRIAVDAPSDVAIDGLLLASDKGEGCSEALGLEPLGRNRHANIRLDLPSRTGGILHDPEPVTFERLQERHVRRQQVCSQRPSHVEAILESRSERCVTPIANTRCILEEPGDRGADRPAAFFTRGSDEEQHETIDESVPSRKRGRRHVTIGNSYVVYGIAACTARDREKVAASERGAGIDRNQILCREAAVEEIQQL